MKFFIDCEFIENGITIDLISIGIVGEDGREYYAINGECNFSKANNWVKENVLCQIGHIEDNYISYFPENGKFVIPKKQIALDILYFIKEYDHIVLNYPEFDQQQYDRLHRLEIVDKPEFWGEWCSYDWVVFCQLFGKMIDLPTGFPMRCRDVIQFAEDQLGISSHELPPSLEIDGNHHALLGAKTVRERFNWLQRIGDAT